MVITHSLLRCIVVESLEEYKVIVSSTEIPFPSSSLTYESVTLISDHNLVSARIFRWFRSAVDNCNSENADMMIRKMIECFRIYKDDLSMPLREYVLTDGIVEVCYRVQAQNSHLISQVLDLLYDCWSSFGPLHFSGILRSKHRRSQHNVFGTVDYLSFFLEHARRKKLEYHGTRMADVSVYCSVRKAPVFIAADIWSWRPLLRYLQFGARFENVIVNPSYTVHGVQSALTDTLRNLIRHLWIKVVQPATEMALTKEADLQEFVNDLTTDTHDLCRTLQVILRAVKRIRMAVLEFVIRDYNGQWMVEVPTESVLSHPVVDLLIPTLNKRYGCPMELQHGCRWIIRNRLNENWQLPYGIGSLPIPNKMKRYLNLLSG